MLIQTPTDSKCNHPLIASEKTVFKGAEQSKIAQTKVHEFSELAANAQPQEMVRLEIDI